MRLTRRGAVLLVVCAAMYGAGTYAGYIVFRAMAGAGFGAVLVAVLLTGRRTTVAVRREVVPDRVASGQPALATLHVRNPGRRRQAGFTAQDTAGTGRQNVLVRALPPGGEATYRYELPTHRRGRYQVGPLILERGDPLGLARYRMTTGEVATLWVHPQRYPVDAVIGRRPRHHHEGRSSETVRGSDDLRDVRPYVVGDEVRHLHWKATARTGQLMVRDLADPHQPRLSVLLDSRSDRLSPDSFEEAVEIVGSVLSAAALTGCHSGLSTTNGTNLQLPGGSLAAAALMDALCELSQETRDGLPLVPAELALASASVGGGVLVVTGATVQPTDLVSLLGRYAPIVVIVVDPGADQVRAPETMASGVRVLTASGAAEAIRLWNTLVATW